MVQDLLLAAIVGLMEGLTGILPVSSTGHMTVVADFVDYPGASDSVGAVFARMGAILSIGAFYRKTYFRLLQPAAWFRKPAGLSVWHVAAGFVPAVLVGFMTHSLGEGQPTSLFTVIIGLVLGSLLMIAAEKSGQLPETTGVGKISLRQAVFVGLYQVLALWPGFSVTGPTISGGLLSGMDRKTAADFSFLVAWPFMMTVCLYDLANSWASPSMADILMFSAGAAVSFAVAWYSLKWLLKFLRRSSLVSFAMYRFLLAGFSYYYFFGH